MPVIVCSKCGGTTNTAVCQWLNPMREDRKANECYLKVEVGVWVKGCGWERADPIYEKPLFEKYLGKKV
jgi:hypothetical protein